MSITLLDDFPDSCYDDTIRVPSTADNIYEFEAADRYFADYNVDTESYTSVLYGLDKLLAMINQYYIKPTADSLREKLPNSMSAELTDTEVFIQYYAFI